VTELDFSLQLAGQLPQDFAPPVPTQGCQVNDQDVSIVVQVVDADGSPVNLRPASAKRILLQRPSGVSVSVDAAFFTNGLDGKMYVVSDPETPLGTGLDEVGTWLVQGFLTIGGSPRHTEVSAFLVLSNIG